MRSIEVSAHVPLPPEAAWDFMFGDKLRHLAAASKMVAGIEGYELRPDGTPRYTMVLKAGPLRVRSVSDYYVYERPRRTVNRVLGGLFNGGTCYIDFHPDGVGTRTDMRVELTPPNRPAGVGLAILRPLLAAALGADLRRWAAAARPVRTARR